ncbi:flagellar motor protein MotD [Xanthomonas campestris pv. campestris]|uniref:flagellar motor protein MotD n=1 Tax=Xanthomonas campestris TaxID=339 RepID=UPI001E5762AB|nr:flagellar motor protein MotD [Xanthomonas campestris]MCC5047915.1 flagellar motor protein MotD [Xanthomonas campestris]MCC5057086.1 flagellar motor protein MotD [Xanthomonas campestris]MCF8809836.1 flagellar motor protein MotD [Xanthomonas campestris pv. campestris]MEA0939394.1 flagellar motor protein MotD [Xanthomonas campestris pv. campestris]MEA0959350.1 flagellar motor protein MotD [Xanthomonas campestris pv. campestris]
MARRRKHHEDHGNHEAWAIPYADLMTLLLAFFVVMYAISSLNEGKYKVMAQALTTAFGGSSKAASPVQLGNTQSLGADYDRPSVIKAGAPMAASNGPTDPTILPSMAAQMRMPVSLRNQAQLARAQRQMDAVAQQLNKTLSPLIDKQLITIRRRDLWIEVEINSDILFVTGSALLAWSARGTLSTLAAVLRDAPNGVRVEGYTDNQPIATAQFPSNWELSAARAASVVHLFADEGVAPQRLAMVGYGEFRARADNSTEAGRNANRRVVLIILADSAGSLAPDPPSQIHATAAGAPKLPKSDGGQTAVTTESGTSSVPAVIEGVH